MTLSEWLDRWLAGVEGTIRPTTFTRYRGTVENHLKPYLGSKKLSQLTSRDIQKLYETLTKRGRQDGQRGLSSGTIRGIHTVFHGALKAAQHASLIARNPTTEELEPPKFRYKDKQVLTDEQLDVFMRVIAEDEIWHDFFYTELTTGLRRGEICGLRWEDFDEVNGTLNVCRTVHVEKGGRRTTWDTKTNAGSRTITLPYSSMEVLRTRKKSTLSD